ncbi:hypothetical protein M3231_12035 [Neobacillus mesonae]|nr:hypothetical protein [Neobacillus mesonae]
MSQLAIHKSHRKLAEMTFMHMDHKTGRIKLTEMPLKLLEEYLLQNLMITRALDEFTNLSMIAYESGDMEWLHDICNAIDLIEDYNFEKK